MNKNIKSFHKAVSVSSILVGTMLFFGVSGYLLSEKFNNQIWFVALLILGVIISLYQTYKIINR